MPYYSNKQLSLLKSCLCKIRFNCIKTCIIRFKTPDYVNQIEYYFNTKQKTAALSNSLLFMIFHVMVLVPITFAKQKEYYMKGQLNMLGLTLTVLTTIISRTGQMFTICLILRLCIHHFLHH